MSETKILIITIILVIIISIVPNKWYQSHVRNETKLQADLFFNKLPTRSDFILLEKRYVGNWKLHEAEVQAVYTTDASPTSICGYYQAQLKHTLWYGSKNIECTIIKHKKEYQHRHHHTVAGLSLKWEDKNNPNRLWFDLTTGTVPDDSTGLFWVPTGKPIVKAKSMGKNTIFSIRVTYYENFEKAFRDCPGEGGETCRYADWDEMVR